MDPTETPAKQPEAAPTIAHSPHQKTNILAIIAIIAAFLIPPVGFILALVAKGQIKKTGEGGKGLATGAIIVSIIMFVVGLAFIAIFVPAAINSVQDQAKSTTTTSEKKATYSADEQNAVSLSDDFLQALDKGDFAAAYTKMSTELQTKVGSSDSFVSEAKAQNLELVKGWEVTGVTTNTDKDRITVKGTLQTSGSTSEGTFELGFYKAADGSIKLFSYDISPG